MSANLNKISRISEGKKLAVKKMPDAFKEKLVSISREELLKSGKISVGFLVRKLKCSVSLAKEIMMELRQPT